MNTYAEAILEMIVDCFNLNFDEDDVIRERELKDEMLDALDFAELFAEVDRHFALTSRLELVIQDYYAGQVLDYFEIQLEDRCHQITTVGELLDLVASQVVYPKIPVSLGATRISLPLPS